MSLWTQVVFVFTIKPNITRENMHEYLTYDINLKKKDNCRYMHNLLPCDTHCAEWLLFSEHFTCNLATNGSVGEA